MWVLVNYLIGSFYECTRTNILIDDMHKKRIDINQIIICAVPGPSGIRTATSGGPIRSAAVTLPCWVCPHWTCSCRWRTPWERLWFSLRERPPTSITTRPSTGPLRRAGERPNESLTSSSEGGRAQNLENIIRKTCNLRVYSVGPTIIVDRRKLFEINTHN